MNQAPLQLRDYWVDFIEVRSNSAYQSSKPNDLDLDLIEVSSNVRQVDLDTPKDNGTTWAVMLHIKQSLPKDKNIPYEFTLDMEGIVAVHPCFEGDKLERSIQVNGPSMLFGAAREIIRAATGRGFHGPVIIPSTNFLQKLPTSPREPKEFLGDTKVNAPEKPKRSKREK